MANMLYQMTSSIDAAFGEDKNGGISKRSIKKDGYFKTKGYTFSFSERERLVQTAGAFAKWLKLAHPEIRMVRELNNEISKEYLLSKHRFNGGDCHSSSVNTYEQSLDKIAHLCNKKFGCNIEMAVNHKELPQDGIKLRRLVMSRDVMNEAMTTMKDGTQGKTCLEIIKDTGVRVSEVVKFQVRDFDFENKIIHIIDSKGGRSRDIALPPKTAEVVKEWIAKKGLFGNDKLFTIRPDSVCNLLVKGLGRVGHGEFAENRTSVHSVRKMVANEMYMHKIRTYIDDKKMSFEEAEKKALGEVSIFLGHGLQRTIEEYVDRFESLADFEMEERQTNETK